jgi:hypothetical protein
MPEKSPQEKDWYISSPARHWKAGFATTQFWLVNNLWSCEVQVQMQEQDMTASKRKTDSCKEEWSDAIMDSETFEKGQRIAPMPRFCKYTRTIVSSYQFNLTSPPSWTSRSVQQNWRFHGHCLLRGTWVQVQMQRRGIGAGKWEWCPVQKLKISCSMACVANPKNVTKIQRQAHD